MRMGHGRGAHGGEVVALGGGQCREGEEEREYEKYNINNNMYLPCHEFR